MISTMTIFKRASTFLAVLAATLFIGAGVANATNDDEHGNDDNHETHKVWICHATSGNGELKNGYNLIEVDTSSTQYEAHQAHATTDPKNNSKFGVLYDIIPAPGGQFSTCGGVPVQPDDKISYTEWTDGQFECNDTTVEQSRTKTTTTYTLVEGEWVGSDTTVIEFQTRDLTSDERTTCQTTTTVDETTTTTEVTTPTTVATLIPTTTVVGDTTTTQPVVPPTGLPKTGFGTAEGLLLAGGLCASGAIMMLLRRKSINA